MASVPHLTRRQGLAAAASWFGLFDVNRRAQAHSEVFAVEAARLRDAAVAAGDQPYGAVVVLDGRIIGSGRSRVITDRNPDAHAERIAVWDAQRQMGREDLSGAVIVATSIPCAVCQRALSRAGISSMRVGPEGRDHGAPRGANP
ncbi:MAG: nucleoside deaminase [Hyphomicrobiales bacterium]|nr:nucleoside deaminase [Hyphomicrobiales bacterium]